MSASNLSVVYDVSNFSSRYFASFTAVMNNSLFDDDLVIINQNKWRVRLALGVRF